MTDLVIIGTGDHARVALETAHALGIEVCGFVEPDEHRPIANSMAGIPVLRRLDSHRFIVAIGDNRVRSRIYIGAIAAGNIPVTLVHPAAVVLGGAEIGHGTHICAAAVIGVDTRIGANVILNTAASVDHDNAIADHAFIAPGCRLAGRVTVDEGAHVGLGSTVVEGRRIGSWSFVAAGAVVTTDVSPSSRVAGVPARPMGDSIGEHS